LYDTTAAEEMKISVSIGGKYKCFILENCIADTVSVLS
jgi:hypothetical protein